MKNAFLLCAVICALAPAAQAADLREVLTKVVVNGQSQPYVGIISVNRDRQLMELALYSDPCGEFTAEPGVFRCLAAPRLVNRLLAPLDRISSSCGSTFFEGQEDLSLADGMRTEIKVTDHRGRLCRDLVKSVILVNATTISPRTQTVTTYELMK